MDYIIDGVNLIKGLADRLTGDFEEEKQKLVSRLERYTAGRKVRMTLVLDSARPSLSQRGRVRVIHDQDADGRIARELSLTKNPAGVAVVSNDREVAGFARRAGARTMKVDEFDDFLAKKLAGTAGIQPGKSEKPSPSKEDADGWMREYLLREKMRRKRDSR